MTGAEAESWTCETCKTSWDARNVEEANDRHYDDRPDHEPAWEPVVEVAKAEAKGEPKFTFADDGTFDTVLECARCNEQVRFTSPEEVEFVDEDERYSYFEQIWNTDHECWPGFPKTFEAWKDYLTEQIGAWKPSQYGDETEDDRAFWIVAVTDAHAMYDLDTKDMAGVLLGGLPPIDAKYIENWLSEFLEDIGSELGDTLEEAQERLAACVEEFKPRS